MGAAQRGRQVRVRVVQRRRGVRRTRRVRPQAGCRAGYGRELRVLPVDPAEPVSDRGPAAQAQRSLGLARARLAGGGRGGNSAFSRSTPPSQFPTVVQQLKRSGLSDSHGRGWRRVVIEKPFGHDLASARELNATADGVFPPEAVFRLDHYLGKETVQNILALRFANEMYEPIWNRSYVDHIQIT